MITEIVRVSIDGVRAGRPGARHRPRRGRGGSSSRRRRSGCGWRSPRAATAAGRYVDDPLLPDLAALHASRPAIPDATETLVDGYITHVELMLGAGVSPYLELSGMDMSAKMDLEEKQLRLAEQEGPRDRAGDLLVVRPAPPRSRTPSATHGEAVATILQTETDIRFLRRLAARNGFECHVRGSTGYLPQPQPAGAAAEDCSRSSSARETNLAEIRIQVDGTPATVAEIRRVDPMAKRVEGERLAASPRADIGPAAARRAAQWPAGWSSDCFGASSRSRPPRCEARLRQAYEDASRFVTADGEIDATRLPRRAARAAGW